MVESTTPELVVRLRLDSLSETISISLGQKAGVREDKTASSGLFSVCFMPKRVAIDHSFRGYLPQPRYWPATWQSW
jgi:hypothetical protein